MNRMLVAKVVFLGAAYGVVPLPYPAQTRPVVTVCEVIRKPTKWENLHVRITGIARVSGFGRDAVLAVMVPDSEQTCSYPSTKYSSPSEPPSIMLMDASSFQPNPPGGSKLDRQSFFRAYEKLRDLQKSNPSIRHVRLTVDGFVVLRKYKLTAEDSRIHHPTDAWTPVVLIVEAYNNIEGIKEP